MPAKIWTDDPRGPSSDIIPTHLGVDLGSPQHPFQNLYVENQVSSGNETIDGNLTVTGNAAITGSDTAASFLLADGSDKNYTIAAYSAGTVYSLTATSAALDFGTTDPAIVLNKAGTYMIQGRVNLQYTGATFAASRTVTLKLRRTNNTPADLTNGTSTLATAIVTTVTATFMIVQLPPVIYTTTVLTDAITIFGDVSVVPSAGNLQAMAASVIATRLY